MKKQGKLMGILLVFLILVAVHGPLFALEIPITVEEPADIDRTQEPITSGIPLPPGTSQTNQWALFDGSLEIPVQVTALKGKTPWILLDFQLSLGDSEKKTLTLRDSSPGVSPQHPLEITDNTSQISVVTGPLKVLINKNTFNLFETVWLDKDNNGSFSSSEQIVSSSGQNIQVLDSTTNQTFSGTQPPEDLVWEYQGPLRATLRIDGKYMQGSTEFIRYTTRLTFYSNKSFVRVEHILRNSVQFNERPVKIKSATLKIGAGTGQLRVNNGNEKFYANVDPNGLTFDMWPSTLSIDGHSNINVDSNGGWVLPDLTHEGRTLVIDFEEGLSSGEQSDRLDRVRSPLFAIASASWYSEYGELSTTKFGTLQDEKDTYDKWGWDWSSSQVPTDSHKPDYLVDWHPDVHDDTESDDLWQNLIMYLRTGSRGYWDRAVGWAWYSKHRYPFRTDGFNYAWDSGYEGPARAVDRPLTSIPLTSLDTSFINRDVLIGRVDISRFGGDHIYGWGMLDYYHLTGDIAALEAAIDLGESSERVHTWLNVPQNHEMNNWAIRGPARHLLLVARLFEVTEDSRWESLMHRIAGMFLASQQWDSRGSWLHPTSGVGTGYFQPFMHSLIGPALTLYHKLTGNTTVRDRLIKMADFAVNYCLHSTYNYSGYWIMLDRPNPGEQFHNSIDDGGVSGFFPSTTVYCVDRLVQGYRLTGNVAYLERAKFHWNRGTKGVKGSYTSRTAADDEVHHFQNTQRSSNGAYFKTNGELPYSNLLFYDYAHLEQGIDLTPPGAPTGLVIAQVDPPPSPGSEDTTNPIISQVTATNIGASFVAINWSTDEPSDSQVEYGTSTSFGSNTPLDTVLATSHSLTLNSLSPNTPYFFRVKSHDAAGNLGNSGTFTFTTTPATGGGGAFTLQNLPDNTWMYANPNPSLRFIPVAKDPDATQQLVETREPQFREFSGAVYGDGKLFYFGGAHSGYPGNDMEIYDIANNIWTQMYKPVVPPNGDPMYGSGGSPNIAPSGDPYTIHGYARTSFDPIRKKYVTTNARGIVEYDPGTNAWQWVAQPGSSAYTSNGGSAPYPSVFSNLPVFPNVGSGEQLSMYDPVLGGFLTTGMYSFQGVWLWNPANAEFDYLGNNGSTLSASGGAASVYIPEQQLHVFARLPEGGNFQGQLKTYDSENNSTASISLPQAIQNVMSPLGNFVMAYDTHNKKLVVLIQPQSGGQPEVWTYDFPSNQWTQHPTSVSTPTVSGQFSSGKGRSIFQYDPTHNVFFLIKPILGGSKYVETWAYRFKN